MSLTHLVLLLSLFCLAAALTEKDIREQWFKFNVKYGKKSRSMNEDSKRFENFKNNVEKIYEHNKLYEQNRVSYKMAINPYADKDLEEMQRHYMGLKISESEALKLREKAQIRLPLRKHNLSLPTSKDWREEGAISPVKNQRACGSCWAFASAAALEAHYFLKHNKSVILSEQNLVDCVEESDGCDGGWMIPAFEYIQENGGINPEDIYPYQAFDDTCRFQPQHIAATCAGYQEARPNDEQHMQEIVATKGPLAVAIEVNANFLNYEEGVYIDDACGTDLNHAVLIVGYGTEDGQDYWLVKNSWGDAWGDEGYIKMARNKKNQCGIALYAVYPEV